MKARGHHNEDPAPSNSRDNRTPAKAEQIDDQKPGSVPRADRSTMAREGSPLYGRGRADLSATMRQVRTITSATDCHSEIIHHDAMQRQRPGAHGLDTLDARPTRSSSRHQHRRTGNRPRLGNQYDHVNARSIRSTHGVLSSQLGAIAGVPDQPVMRPATGPRRVRQPLDRRRGQHDLLHHLDYSSLRPRLAADLLLLQRRPETCPGVARVARPARRRRTLQRRSPWTEHPDHAFRRDVGRLVLRGAQFRAPDQMFPHSDPSPNYAPTYVPSSAPWWNRNGALGHDHQDPAEQLRIEKSVLG